jgi:hypothetical protein
MFGWVKRCAAIGAAALCMAVVPSAKANSILLTEVNVTGPVGGLFTYNFSARLTVGNELHTSDYLVLYDVSGFNGVTSATSGALATPAWTVTTSPTTPAPFGQSIVESNALNIVLTYVGAPTVTAAGVDVQLGAFSFQSSGARDPGNPIKYEAQDHVTGVGSPPGSQQGGNTDFIVGPAAVPLPGVATAGMGLIGLVGGGSLLRRRRA